MEAERYSLSEFHQSGSQRRSLTIGGAIGGGAVFTFEVAPEITKYEQQRHQYLNTVEGQSTGSPVKPGNLSTKEVAVELGAGTLIGAFALAAGYYRIKKAIRNHRLNKTPALAA